MRIKVINRFIACVCVLFCGIMSGGLLNRVTAYENYGGYDWANFKGEVNYAVNHPEDTEYIPTIKKQTWLYLLGQGYTKEAAAGVMGNMMAEGGFDPTVTEGHVAWSSFPWWSDSAGGGLGMVGFTYHTLKEDIGRECVSNNVDWTCLDVQLNVLMKQLQSAMNSHSYDSRFTSYDQFKNTASISDATIAMLYNFERCQGYTTQAVWDKRTGFAQDVYNEFKNVTGTYDPSNNPKVVGGNGSSSGNNCTTKTAWLNIPICDDESAVKICTWSSAIKTTTSEQYKLFHEGKYGEVNYDDLGLGYIMDKDPATGKTVKYYTCALTCYYMKDIGEKFKMTLKSGTEIYIITCDITQAKHSSEGSRSGEVSNWRDDDADKTIYGNPKYCIGDGRSAGAGYDRRILEFYTEDRNVLEKKFKAKGATFTGHFEADYDEEHKFAGPMVKMEKLVDGATVCDGDDTSSTTSNGDLVGEWSLTGMPDKPTMAEGQTEINMAEEGDLSSQEKYLLYRLKDSVVAENKDELVTFINRLMSTVGLAICIYALLLFVSLLFDLVSPIGRLLPICTFGGMSIDKRDKLTGVSNKIAIAMDNQSVVSCLKSVFLIMALGVLLSAGVFWGLFELCTELFIQILPF